MSIYIVSNDEYLAHHGIKGQRWGIRRYQNPDGSLTNKAKARAYKDATKGNKWAKGKHQPSSFLASVSAGSYAARPTKRKADRLDRQNAADELRFKAAHDAAKNPHNYKDAYDQNKAASRKKLVKRGAIAVGAALTAVGGYYLYKNGGLRGNAIEVKKAITDRGKQSASKTLDKQIEEYNKRIDDAINSLYSPLVNRTQINRTSVPRTSINRTSITRTPVNGSLKLKDLTMNDLKKLDLY